MRMTATELRARLYRVLAHVAETGDPVEVTLKGRTLRIIAQEEARRTFSFESLKPHPEAFEGDLDDIVHMDWSGEWRPQPEGDP